MSTTFIWHDRDTWPRKGPGYTPLADALLKVGAACIKSWTGRELALPWANRLPKSVDEDSPLSQSPSVIAAIVNELRLAGVSDGEVSKEAWEEMLDARRASDQRRKDAEEEVRQLCAYGRLTSAVRNHGNYHTIKASFWNTEDVEEVFISCAADVPSRQLNHPIDDGRISLNPSFPRPIFIADAGLDVLAPDPTPNVLDVYLSPYMQLALRTSREVGMSDERQVKLEAVRDFIDKHWAEYHLPPSENMQSAMATMVRHPSSQAGRKRQR